MANRKQCFQSVLELQCTLIGVFHKPQGCMWSRNSGERHVFSFRGSDVRSLEGILQESDLNGLRVNMPQACKLQYFPFRYNIHPRN